MVSFDVLIRMGLLIAAGNMIGGCATRAAASPVRQVQSNAGVSSLSWPTLPSLQTPIVLAVAGNTNTLQYWPFSPGPHPKPTQLRGFVGSTAGGMAANGSQLVIANGNGLVVYDVQTNHQSFLPDPGGTPYDVAIGKTGTVYVTNSTQNGGNVEVYGSNAKPRTLQCSLIHNADYIAVDNEGDVFLNQDGPGYFGVIEIPNGPRGLDAAKCAALKLNPGDSGYAGGIAIDPTTDNLLVLDNPSLCAGGIEGRVTTYRKPYQQGVGTSLDLGQNCAGLMRLDARSNVVFISDTNVDESASIILEASYPGGKPLGAFSGGNPAGFTTIPNRLPN